MSIETTSVLGTGVSMLDAVVGGGLVPGDVIVLVGGPGSGKTTLSCQIAFHAAAGGSHVVYVSTLSESPARLARHLASYTFFDESLVGERLFLASLYPLIRRGARAVIDALVRVATEHRANVLIVDGMTTIRDLDAESPDARSFIYELASALSASTCTVILTTLASSETESTTGALGLFGMADSVLELVQHDDGPFTTRAIRVRKMRGAAPLLGLHCMRIDDDGVHVYPRIESLPLSSDGAIVGPSRVPFGIPALDAMMSGGPPERSVTLCAGASGSGTTVLALRYIVEGARLGERGLIVSFRESSAQLMAKALSFGMDLQPLVAGGSVELMQFTAAELLGDAVLAELRTSIERFHPRRLTIDSVVELEQMFSETRRRREVAVGLTKLLRASNVTSVITRAVGGAGPDATIYDSPLVTVAENIVVLRHVEEGGAMHRIVSVAKMRDVPHDESIRCRYEITSTGIELVGGEAPTEGVRDGCSRAPPEGAIGHQASPEVGPA